jgi:hypothetical protein
LSDLNGRSFQEIEIAMVIGSYDDFSDCPAALPSLAIMCEVSGSIPALEDSVGIYPTRCNSLPGSVNEDS